MKEVDDTASYQWLHVSHSSRTLDDYRLNCRSTGVSSDMIARLSSLTLVHYRYGGELNSQSAFWTIGIMTIFSAAVGILNVKKTRVHRKWMLREYHSCQHYLTISY